MLRILIIGKVNVGKILRLLCFLLHIKEGRLNVKENIL